MTRLSLPRLAAFASVVLAVLACRADLAGPGERPPASPPPSVQRHDAKSPLPRAGPSPVACLPRHPASVSALVGPTGGVLAFGASRLIVPPGALHATVRLSAVTRGDASATVDFFPEGLRFHKPAGLVLSATGCLTPAEGVPSVVYLGENGEILETIAATYDRRGKEVAAPIVHFSGYAIAF